MDAWIPDSQLWVEQARATQAGARRVPATGPLLARTALVIAMPRAAAAQFPAYGTTVGWRFLLPHTAGGPPATLRLNVEFPDPTQSATGLASLVEFRKILGYGRAARFALARFVFTAQAVPAVQGGASLTALDQPVAKTGVPNPVTVASEQAVVQYDAAHPTQPLAVRYPAGGTSELAYPYLVTATDRADAAVAKAFGAVLRSSYASAYVRYAGFRTGTGQAGSWPAGDGLDQREPALLPLPRPGKIASALRAWLRLSHGQRLLALNDVSAAMAVQPAPGGPTLEQMLGHAAALGLARFPNSTQMGLWTFPGGRHSQAAYKQRVPLGPLLGPFGLLTRRQAIEHAAATATTVGTEGTALYRAILAAYHQMASTYQARYSNAIIVMTAGVDDPRGDISAATLLRDLKTMYDRSRPVNVVMIMIGTAGNFEAMQQIATATNGKAYDITRPGQIKQVFFHAMGRRICQPHCPK